MQIPVYFKCICGLDDSSWFDFYNKNLNQTQVFTRTCPHECTNTLGAISNTFIVIVRNMSFKADSIIGLPKHPDGDPK